MTVATLINFPTVPHVLGMFIAAILLGPGIERYRAAYYS
jgi:hypothetical protein